MVVWSRFRRQLGLFERGADIWTFFLWAMFCNLLGALVVYMLRRTLGWYGMFGVWFLIVAVGSVLYIYVWRG